MKKALAKTAVIDYVDHRIVIDGVQLPWHLAAPGPDIDMMDPEIPVVTLNLPIIIDGNVLIRTAENSHLIDPIEGEIGSWARRIVREELLKRFPDLDLPEGIQ